MKTTLIAASLAFAVSTAQAVTVDFSTGVFCSSSASGTGTVQACGLNSYLHQNYGDVAGVVDVTYRTPLLNPSQTLHWYGPNYNDLQGVAYAPGGNPNSYGRIELKPLNGLAIDLTHFDLGAWFNTTRNTTVDVYEIGNTAVSLFGYSGPVGAGSTTHASFNPNIAPSTVGFWIDWRFTAYDVGIDNITFDVAAVIPEPETYALLLAGLGLIGFAARRRKPLQR